MTNEEVYKYLDDLMEWSDDESDDEEEDADEESEDAEDGDSEDGVVKYTR